MPLWEVVYSKVNGKEKYVSWFIASNTDRIMVLGLTSMGGGNKLVIREIINVWCTITGSYKKIVSLYDIKPMIKYYNIIYNNFRREFVKAENNKDNNNDNNYNNNNLNKNK